MYVEPRISNEPRLETIVAFTISSVVRTYTQQKEKRVSFV